MIQIVRSLTIKIVLYQYNTCHLHHLVNGRRGCWDEVRKKSEFIPDLQAPAHALALADVALYAHIKGQGRIFGISEGQAQLAHARTALEIRCVYLRRCR